MAINPSLLSSLTTLSLTTLTHKTLYFAFGSNLHLLQMSLRCPSSLYLGHATLPYHRFQINERGYANVVDSSSPEDYVQGLVYLLGEEDERGLDANEGVPWAYEKAFLDVDLVVEAEKCVAGRSVVEIVGQGVLDSLPPSIGGGERVKAKVLVYKSTAHTTDGKSRIGYVTRMNNGIVDAVKLGGLSQAYVEGVMRKWIPEKVEGNEDMVMDLEDRAGLHLRLEKSDDLLDQVVNVDSKGKGYSVQVTELPMSVLV